MKVDYIVNDDCFNLIATLPDQCIDLVIVDPPYGDNDSYGRKQKTILNNENEEINYRFLRLILPKLKQNKSLYLFSNHKYAHLIREYATSIGYAYRMQTIMVKNNIGMGYGFRNQYEVCLVLEKGKAKYNLNNMSNVWKMKHVQHDEHSHPHQKQYDIIRKIIMHSSQPGDIVFDGFMGSASTAIACHKEHRHYIGAELDPKWYHKANETLDALKSQLTMFK